MKLLVDVAARKLAEHSPVSDDMLASLARLTAQIRTLAPRHDVVRQGDKCNVSILVISGMLARYHTLRNGRRQYLSFHISGDWPDIQSLYIEKMDHGVCAIDEVTAAFVPHEQLEDQIKNCSDLAIAFWRETLIDAAVFRETITNNSAREPVARIAHFFCERYYRARAGRHERPGVCSLPVNQTQLGEALGMSVVTTNRAVQELRRTKTVDWIDGILKVLDWPKLAEIGAFDPSYLHLRRAPRL